MVLKSFVIRAINATVDQKLTLLSPFLFFFHLFITPSKKRERTVQKLTVFISTSKSPFKTKNINILEYDKHCSIIYLQNIS